jgi:L-ascorbate 6-phosphate lactonase
MSPWDLWRVAEALNTKVILPMHHDNWANCFEDPRYLEEIVKWKNAEKRHPSMSVVSLLPGARYIHPVDNDGRRYSYPDNREMCNWRNSQEYGPDSDIG